LFFRILDKNPPFPYPQQNNNNNKQQKLSKKQVEQKPMITSKIYQAKKIKLKA
jgi:hypothetical protein